MPAKRQNGIVVPVNSDPYNLAAQLAAMADSTNAVIICENLAARNSLSPYEGMVVCRLDRKGTQEVFVNGAWSGPSDHVLVPTTGVTTYENVMNTIPLRVNQRNGLAVLNGRVRRVVGDGNLVATIPLAVRPLENINLVISTIAAGNNVGPTMGFDIIASSGQMLLTVLGNGQWINGQFGTWIPFNVTYPISLLS